MATISLIFPADGPETGIVLTSLNDASTGASIAMPSNPAFTAATLGDGTKQWSITVSAPASFKVLWRATVTNTGGSTSLLPADGAGVVDGDAVVPSGRYATLTDLYNVWSTGLIKTWSNPDPVPGANVPALNAPAVQSAFNRATATIHAKFRSLFVVPFAFTDPTELTRVATWEATLAGYYLYQPSNPVDRVVTQTPTGAVVAPSNDYAKRVANVMDDMAVASMVQFSGALAAQLIAGISFAPSVV